MKTSIRKFTNPPSGIQELRLIKLRKIGVPNSKLYFNIEIKTHLTEYHSKNHEKCFEFFIFVNIVIILLYAHLLQHQQKVQQVSEGPKRCRRIARVQTFSVHLRRRKLLQQISVNISVSMFTN